MNFRSQCVWHCRLIALVSPDGKKFPLIWLVFLFAMAWLWVGLLVNKSQLGYEITLKSCKIAPV